ncbi:MAG: HAMP domain-containing protein [Proteobacteria bacterium]|nr:HAMP domain-containing protein [Pseudomonadota bacterium]
MTGRYRDRLPTLPLGLQLLGLLIAALAVAQLVTLALTVLIPPAPQQRWHLAAVAQALSGGALSEDLERRTLAGPPDLSEPGWLVSESSRQALAKAVNHPQEDVVLAFYTQLPVGGTAVPIERHGGAKAISFSVPLVAAAQAQAMPGGPPPGGMPGRAMPGGGFPGGAPPGIRPQGAPPPGASPPGGAPPAGGRTPHGQSTPTGPAPGSAPSAGQAAAPPAAPPPVVAGPTAIPAPIPRIPAEPQPAITLPQPRPAANEERIAPASGHAAPIQSPQPVATAEPSPPAPALAKPPSAVPGVISVPVPARVGDKPQPIPFRRDGGVLAFTTPPFIEGDFVAALRQSDGRWVAVAPRAEAFPNAWQRRVMTWFILSLLLVAPAAWYFARRIVKPLEGFARAAETLGRDPAATVVPLSGPAEIGRAANAFNLMHSRLRTFVDDRTAMVGAISHDLRTPLTRMRFRIEDVPDQQRDGLLAEVEEMESLISQVIAFIRDASTPGVRERVDLGQLVQQTVTGTKVLGGRIAFEPGHLAPVEVDPVGIRRLLTNLLENAVKYGGGARVKVGLSGDTAIAEVIDDGPGIAPEDREKAFEPFFRSEAARKSGKTGSGLGLAVCRSIARAHGGEVTFEQRSDGFVVKVSLPLVYDRAA